MGKLQNLAIVLAVGMGLIIAFLIIILVWSNERERELVFREVSLNHQNAGMRETQSILTASYWTLTETNRVLQDYAQHLRLQVQLLEEDNEFLVALLEAPSEETSPALNPIDSFFAEIENEHRLMDGNTHNMVVYSVILAQAWRAEMENFRDILLSRTQNDFVAETMNDEIYHFLQYISHLAEIEAMISASNAFWEDDYGLFFGSAGRIVRSGVIADGYRTMALELFRRLHILDFTEHQWDGREDFSYFVFNEEHFREWIDEEFPWIWRYTDD
ncbi:MAG: hypothetical protein FWD97_04610 [Defluviitaleaceae bacterium]|nr:hypothetical protein [Defluviitaleaceae bacterium]